MIGFIHNFNIVYVSIKLILFVLYTVIKQTSLMNINKDLTYYANQNKVFWVVNKDITIENGKILANSVVPCIFIEEKDNKKLILQLDESIKYDEYKYTAWRKFLGMAHDTYINVLLIVGNESSQWHLYTLTGKKIAFANIGRSSVKIDKTFLAKFDFVKEKK